MNGPTDLEIKHYLDSLKGLSDGEIEAFGGGARLAYYEEMAAKLLEERVDYRTWWNGMK